MPHVAGVAALYLEQFPGAQPWEVSKAILVGATQGRLQTDRFKAGTPNRLLYSRLGSTSLVQSSEGP